MSEQQRVAKMSKEYTLSWKNRDGESFSKSFSFDSIVKIGSLSSSHVRLDQEDVSRMHCVIEKVGEDLFMLDLGSATGTFINGERVRHLRLRSGDSIQVGSAELKISF